MTVLLNTENYLCFGQIIRKKVSWNRELIYSFFGNHVIISGKLDVTGDGKSSILGPGDTWVNPIGQKHMIKAIEDTVFVEIKSPAPDFSSFLKLD